MSNEPDRTPRLQKWYQFSLKALLIATAAVSLFAAALGGAFGELVQMTAVFTVVLPLVFVFEALIVATVIISISILFSLPFWLVARSMRTIHRDHISGAPR